MLLQSSTICTMLVSKSRLTTLVRDIPAWHSWLGTNSTRSRSTKVLSRHFAKKGERHDKIVQALLNLSKGLEIKTTVEGIEENAQLAYFLQEGCDIGQGYLFGTAMPASETLSLLKVATRYHTPPQSFWRIHGLKAQWRAEQRFALILMPDHRAGKDLDRTSSMKTPLPTDIYVGARIRMQRTFLHMSQAVLGQRLGITFQQIQKYENGTNRVGPSRIHQISEIFQVPISFFFPDVGQRQPVTQSIERSDELSLFLQTAQGRELNCAFRRIRDPKVRKAVVGLAKSMAGKNSVP